MNPQLIPPLIFLFPFAFSLIIPTLNRIPKAAYSVATGALLISFILSVFGFFQIQSGEVITHFMGGWIPPIGIEWKLDALSAFMCLIVSGISLLVVFASGGIVQTELRKGRIPYYTTVLLSTAGLFGILLTNDLFNLFVFLEVSSLTTYALVATGDRKKGNVASFRYLLIGTLGASFYLLGVGYLYATTGTLNLSDMAIRLNEVAFTKTTLLGFILIFVGLAIKMGLFPFHGWLPDAYTHASDPASSLLAPLATKVSIYAFIRVFYGLLGPSQMDSLGFSKALLILGVIAMIAGSLMALRQTNFKRMLAYSSVSHIGLIAAGIGINHPIAFVGVMLHILFHAVMKATLFLVATGVYRGFEVRNIDDFSKLRGHAPITMRAILLASLSMIGIPPLCGFFSKWYILVGAVESGQTPVAFIIVLSSLLTGLYFFKLLEKVFFTPKGPEDTLETKINYASNVRPLFYSFAFLAVSLLAFGALAPFLYQWGLQFLAVVVS